MGTKVLQGSDSPHGDNFKSFQVLNTGSLKMYFFFFFVCVHVCWCPNPVSGLPESLTEGTGGEWNSLAQPSCLSTAAQPGRGLVSPDLLIKVIVNIHTTLPLQIT